MESFIEDALMARNQFEPHTGQTDSLYFTDLDTMAMIPCDQDYGDRTAFQMETLENPDVQNWSGEECYAWVNKVCQSLSLDHASSSVANFMNVTGADLMNCSQYDFCTMLDFDVGTTVYREFKDLLRKRGIVPSSPVPWGLSSTPESEMSFHDMESSQLTDLSLETPYNMDSLENLLLDPEFCKQFDDFDESQTNDLHGDYFFFKTEESSNTSYSDNLFHEVPYSPESSFSSLSPSNSLSPPSPSTSLSPSPSPTPSSSSGLSSGRNILEKITTKSRKRVRGPKNWEYLMRMLMDKQYNPSVIRWEDEAAHTFRIVKPSVIAQMWGNRSNKPNLTYDNFARGLRYHYTTGALEAVSVRQLVYRCGPKALKYLRDQLHYEPEV